MKRISTSRIAPLLASLALVAAGCVSDDPDPNAAVLSPDTTVEVMLSEFSYLPANLTVVAGSTVTLTLVNDGFVDHEFMAGEDLAEGGGFETDLLVRILTGAEGVKYATAGVTFADASGDHAADGDAMTDEEMAAMDDGDADHAADGDAMTDEGMAAMDDGDADHAEDGDAMTDEEMAAMDDGGHAGHTGAAVTVLAGGRVTLEFVVPDDAVGTWTFGCFIEGHFKAGMNGTITVLPAAA